MKLSNINVNLGSIHLVTLSAYVCYLFSATLSAYTFHFWKASPKPSINRPITRSIDVLADCMIIFNFDSFSFRKSPVCTYAVLYGTLEKGLPKIKTRAECKLLQTSTSTSTPMPIQWIPRIQWMQWIQRSNWLLWIHWKQLIQWILWGCWIHWINWIHRIHWMNHIHCRSRRCRQR